MDRDDIIRMARESGFMPASHPFNPWSAHTDQIEAFANLVAAHEREQCAKFCRWMIEKAIADEREACRLIVLDNSDSEGICCTDDVLEALRQRGEK